MTTGRMTATTMNSKIPLKQKIADYHAALASRILLDGTCPHCNAGFKVKNIVPSEDDQFCESCGGLFFYRVSENGVQVERME